MQAGDRLICAFVDKLDIGEQFTDWPLHVTIVPWFRTSLTTDELAMAMQSTLYDNTPFQIVMAEEATFGRGKTVNLVAHPMPFDEAEQKIRQVLKANKAWLVDETTKRQHDYKPHVTEQKDTRLYTGDTFICNEFYIVEQKGKHKTITGKIGLGNETAA